LREHGYADAADVLDSPNNLLGVEYLLNLRAAYSHVLPETVARIGTAHDSRTVQGEFCSASQIRRFLQSDLTGAAPYLPAETLEILKERQLAGQAPIYLKPLETAILSRLRMMDQAYLSRIAGVSEGLENRLYQAIRTHHSLEEIATAVKTKRYPLSRIRRILLCAAIGITAKDQTAPPTYLRVLGQNQKGNEILRLMKHSAKLPIVLRSSDFDGLSPAAHRMFRLENLATDLYTMAYTPMGECGTEYTRNLYSYTKGEGK
jgi:predicted nucleotidyltransferase